MPIANPRTRCGAAAVELAVVLPVLMLLALGCVDLGRAAALNIALSNAARVGAEYGATHRYTSFTLASWQSQVKQEVTAEMQSVRGFDGSNLSTSIQTTTDATGILRITVTASYPFQTVTSWPGLPHDFSILLSVTDRQYQ
ncbi:MAG TPA: TadE family protein [Planctomycetaceae bacterium]